MTNTISTIAADTIAIDTIAAHSDAVVAYDRALVSYSPVFGSALPGFTAAAGSPSTSAAGAQSGLYVGADAMADWTTQAAPAARRHRAAGASVLDSRFRIDIR